MGDRLFVAVLGHRNAGKSKTWNSLFGYGHDVKTGIHPRRLDVRAGEWVEVFLVSGSFEERQLYAGDILEGQSCKIILCSIQYIDVAIETVEYIKRIGFDLYVQWLNPGYKDPGIVSDRLGFVQTLLDANALLSIRSGKVDPSERVQEIREFIYGWSLFRGLVNKS